MLRGGSPAPQGSAWDSATQAESYRLLHIHQANSERLLGDARDCVAYRSEEVKSSLTVAARAASRLAGPSDRRVSSGVVVVAAR